MNVSGDLVPAQVQMPNLPDGRLERKLLKPLSRPPSDTSPELQLQLVVRSETEPEEREGRKESLQEDEEALASQMQDLNRQSLMEFYGALGVRVPSHKTILH